MKAVIAYVRTIGLQNRKLYPMRRFWFALLPVAFVVLLVSCSSTRTLLQTAPTKPHGMKASPALPATSLAQWQQVDAPRIRNELETNLYGHYPEHLTLKRKDQRILEGRYFDNSATVTLETLEITNRDTGVVRTVGLVMVRPVNAPSGIPVIMMESFCPNTSVIPLSEVPKVDGNLRSCEGHGLFSRAITYFFGRYISTPPIADIMKRGYALASVFPSEFIPDSAEAGLAALDEVFNDQPAQTRTHAVMAWAALYAKLSDYLKADKGYAKTIAYGHSRFAKAALVAAAFDPSIDGVIAHQSGTGGASLSRDKTGEGIASISENYPHWFVPKYSEYANNKAALPVDQHELLALIAPRPLLLGNARRDVWSDPNGAFRAAEAATTIYGLYGSQGLRQKTLKAYDPAADIAFWMRPGTHGVVKEDWPAFLEFLDAHFK
jgi:(4-O-methyl)-D-glucuronate---lignin esterase